MFEKQKEQIKKWKELNANLSKLVQISRLNNLRLKKQKLLLEKETLIAAKKNNLLLSNENEISPSRNEIFLVLKKIPGVGDFLAKKLMEKYLSIEDLKNATQTELQTIEKLGPKTANKIISFFLE